ncbi:unnamed protein product [Rhodiola kirilowii]
MERSMLTQAAKRSYYIAAADATQSRLSPPLAEARKRSRVSEPEVSLGQVSFRMLCHASRVGGIIGKSGSVIKQLQLETMTKIRIENRSAEVVDRVIVISGSASVKPSMLLIRRSREGNWGGDIEVSAAQEALLRVFEKVLEVAAETDGVYIGPGRVVSCRLLVETSQTMVLIARGGRVLENIKAETGTRIEVLSAEKLQPCANPTDDLVEIQGEVLAVKRALVAISGCLQSYVDSVEKDDVMESRFLDSHLELLPERHVIQPRGSLMRVPISRSPLNHILDGRLSPTNTSRLPTQNLVRQDEVSFKILCSNDKVGRVLGKGGSIIKALQTGTGATISIGPQVDDCDDRLITVKATENVESQHSEAQKALVLVFCRFGEVSTMKGAEPDIKRGTSVEARLVVPKNHIGCLLGKGGTTISEIRKITGTGMHILKTTEVPKCASDTDQVVQITGEFVKVQDALHHVTSRLRDKLFPRKTLSYDGTRSISSIIPETILNGRVRDTAPTALLSSDVVPHRLTKDSNQLHITDYHGFPRELDRYVSPRTWTSQTVSGQNVRDLPDIEGFSSIRRGVDLGSGSMAAVITNTTIEIKIPDRLLSSVYGENGNNLARLRQISGARVILQEPNPGTREGTIVISGTPDETQAAQNLLQAFILTGSS